MRMLAGIPVISYIFGNFYQRSLKISAISQPSVNFTDLRSQLSVRKTRHSSADSENFDQMNSQLSVYPHADPLAWQGSLKNLYILTANHFT